MTINATPRKAGPYIGNGSVHTYGFSFKVLDPTHLTVVEADAAGAEIALILASDYTVLLNEDQEATPGGTVTRVVETVPTALPMSYRWTILSATPYSQAMDLPSGGPFSAVVVENGLDNLEIQVQQVVETLERAVLVPPTSSETSETIVASLIASAVAADADAAAAAASASAAATSETNAAASAGAAATSETNAAASETAAGVSETNAAASETAAGVSETNAAASETAAGVSETNAAASAGAAATSATNASNSAGAAATSETNAAASAGAAATSATNASNSATAAAAGNGGRYSATVGGTADAITLTPAVALGAYVAGEAITFIAAGTNTGAVTVNVSGLGAKSVTKTGATALVAGEIVAGQTVTLRYDGTRYQVITPAVGTAAAKNVGTSGATVPLCNTNLTLGATGVTIGDGATGASIVNVSGAAGNDRGIRLMSGGVLRLSFVATNETESGGNAGSNLALYCASDAGAFLQTAFQVRRSDGSVVIGGPTGGFKGYGSINASAVYDDSVLLTCYAIEAELTGKVTKARWDDSALNRELTRPDGRKTTEVTTHEPAARFAPRAADMLDPKRYGELWRATGHLAAMPSPAEWEAAGKKMGVGDIVQRLWETVEVQAIHIDKLLARIEALEAKP
jgi:hypothetical protein